MNYLSKNRTINLFKTWALFAGFLVLVIGLGFIFARAYQNNSILYFAVIFSVGTAIFSYWFSDKMVLAMVKAEPIDQTHASGLYELVENLTKKANLPMPKIYIVQEDAPNAFATGRNPSHAVVCVTTGILKKINREELEGVLAHELSHVANRDMLISTVAVILAGFLSILSNFFMRSMWFGGMRRRDDRDESSQLFAILAIVGAILAPIAGMLMQLAISRRRESLADISGALLTGKPENLASALIKISSDSTPMSVANNTTAHLWVDNPFKGKQKTNWLVKLFLTHPPIEERIRALRGLKI